MVFDLYSGSTLVQSSIGITAISGTPNGTTATLTLDQVVTTSANDVLIRAGAGVSGEIQGLLTQLDGGTSTVFGVVRADYMQTQGNVIYQTSTGATGGAGLALSLDSMQKLQDETERRGGGGVNAFYCDYSTRRMYNKLLVADKRYVNSMKGDGGFAAKDKSYLEFNGVPLVADKDCPVRLFALPSEQIEKYVLSEMAFADDTGDMLIAQMDNDQLECRVRFFMNLFNSKASASGVLTEYISP